MTSTRTTLHDLTASRAAELIRTREVSPVELVEALLARAAALDPRVQAWVTLDAERARASAREAEQQVMSGAELPLLHGVPFGVKDIFDTTGIPTAAGFKPFSSRVPPRDADAVARLKAAGAVLLGKMVTTQFAYADPSRTRNPWDDARTPGGSSSGSAAGVAARLVPFALGSQTAGSVLRPAAYNGVIGFKPTYGRVSKSGVLPLAWSLDHVGLLARSVADCEAFLAAAADPASDARTQPDKPLGAAPRFGLVREALGHASSLVREHVAGIAAKFEGAGARVQEVSLGEPLDLILATHHVTMQTETAAVHWQMLEQYPGAHQPKLRAYVEAGRLLPGVAYVHAQRVRTRIREAIRHSLNGIDVLLLPTAVAVAPGRDTTGEPSLQAPFSLVGFPSMSLPSGLSQPESLPLAIQLVARPWQEATLLAVANWCESELPALPHPPGFA